MSEGPWYLAAGIVAFSGIVALALTGPSWPASAMLAAGLGAGLVGVWLHRRRAGAVRMRVEDDHLHPIPVLDAPKGTYDLIAGMEVRVENRRDEPVGVSIDTVLYRRTQWSWDRPVSDAPAVPLLVPSVVPGRSDKSFFVKNYTRIPEAVEALTTRHFVKLVVTTSDAGKSVHRVFLRERYELPKESPAPAPRPAMAADRAPLLPFSERAEPAAPSPRKPPLVERLAAALRRLGIGGDRRVEIHRLKNGDDSLEGLVDELKAELGDDPPSNGRARGGGSNSFGGR